MDRPEHKSPTPSSARGLRRAAWLALVATCVLVGTALSGWQIAAQAPPTASFAQAFEVAADSLDVDAATGEARFSGNVTARRGEWILTCSSLVATYDDQGTLMEAYAQGPVQLAGPDVRAQAAQAHFVREGDMIELTGEPTVERGQHKIVAERARVYLDEQRVEMDKVRGRFVLDGEKRPVKGSP